MTIFFEEGNPFVPMHQSVPWLRLLPLGFPDDGVSTDFGRDLLAQ